MTQAACERPFYTGPFAAPGPPGVLLKHGNKRCSTTLSRPRAALHNRNGAHLAACGMTDEELTHGLRTLLLGRLAGTRRIRAARAGRRGRGVRRCRARIEETRLWHGRHDEGDEQQDRAADSVCAAVLEGWRTHRAACREHPAVSRAEARSRAEGRRPAPCRARPATDDHGLR